MTMILTEVGEVGLHDGGRTVVLRPSLYAMQSLGAPTEVIQHFIKVMGPFVSVQDAAVVLQACTDEDISDLTGYTSLDAPELPWVAGRMEPLNVVHIARSLLRHGIAGVSDRQPGSGGAGGELKAFRARDFVALAMAHLGLSEREAWGMTMTGLGAALMAKFPPQKGGRGGTGGASGQAPTKEEHTATMEWFDRVEAARARAKGNH